MDPKSQTATNDSHGQNGDMEDAEISNTSAIGSGHGKLNQDKQSNVITSARSQETMVSQESRQILRDKMKEVFAKIISDIDEQVLTVSESQSELDLRLDRLMSTLDSIKVDDKLTDEISANAKRISSLKSRLTLVHTILSNSSARCSRTLEACGAAYSSLNVAATASLTATSTPQTTSPSPSNSIKQ